MKNPEYRLQDTISTEQFGEVKVSKIFANLEDPEDYVYEVFEPVGQEVYLMKESEFPEPS